MSRDGDYRSVTHHIARIGEAWTENVFELAGLPTEVVDQALAEIRSLDGSGSVEAKYIDALEAAIKQEREAQAEEDAQSEEE